MSKVLIEIDLNKVNIAELNRIQVILDSIRFNVMKDAAAKDKQARKDQG